MSVVISGSIATDHLMTYPGKFSEQFLPDQLDKISMSFLVSDLEVRRGGVGANIAFALGVLGQKPYLLGAAGQDFDEYDQWLTRHGVDTSLVRIEDSLHTARFVCTTDTEQAQLASFYPGAMANAEKADLGVVTEKIGTPDIVLIGANDPGAMVTLTEECRAAGVPFAADPSQQLVSLDAEQIAGLVDGAAYLFSNEYELGLILHRTGWTVAELDSRVGVRVTTKGKDGASVFTAEGEVSVGIVPARTVADPTGLGDAFRAGFLTGVRNGRSVERAAQLGALIATYVIETTGPQEWTLHAAEAAERLREAFGDESAKDLAELLPA